MPKHLNSRCKELISSLITYFEREKANNGPLLPVTAVRERVAEALNISISTVSSISQAVKNNEILRSPPTKRPHKKSVTNTELLDTNNIRDVIYDMYKCKQHVTLDSLQTKLKERELFNGCRTSLWKLLRGIGFKWKKNEPRRGLIELSDVAVKRVEFLRNYISEKQASLFQFIFIDETWIFQNGTIGRSWQNDDKRSIKTTKVDGKRHIILNAGGSNGFVEGAQAIYSSKTQLSDYHGEMNRENFLHWFENQLLMNLEEPSIIVMDNAPYHSMLLNKTPNSSWTKSDIQEWLTKQKINFFVIMLKCELLNIVSQNKPPKIYVVDSLAEQYGHKVLRLPPYHCMFNPIELVWGISKNYYNPHIGRDGNKEQDCLNMWAEAINTISTDTWKNSIEHTEKDIARWYERDRVLDRMEISPIIIQDDGDDDTSDSNVE